MISDISILLQDINITVSQLQPNAVKQTIRVDWDLWTHRDFIKGIDADKFVYEPTIEILLKSSHP